MTPPRTETVPLALAGQRLDRVVALVGDVSRADAASLLAQGRVTVDAAPQDKGSLRVTEGAVVTVDLPDPTPQGLVPEPDVEVPVAYADDDVVVVDKPAGLVVHPGAGHDHGTLAAGLVARYPEIAAVGEPDRPGIVHRLDRDTSGLLVVARTPEAHASLVEQLSTRTVTRRYLALVVGHPESRQGLVDAPIARSPRQPTLMAVRADGKEARTRYEVQETFDRPSSTALVTCQLETGRTHQIRVHMKAIGHPVVGDGRYGGGRSQVASPRVFLHAAHLGFRHPRTGDEVSFDSPLPDDLAEVLAGLRAAST